MKNLAFFQKKSNGNQSGPRTRRDVATRFGPGQSGNLKGRPKGSRNRFSEEFFADLHESWLLHGPATLERVRLEHPVEYLKLFVRLLPKKYSPPRDPWDDMSDEELEQGVMLLRRMIAAERAKH